MNHLHPWLFSFFLALFFGASVEAFEIIAIKNHKVLIELNSEQVHLGDELWAIDENGKKVAVLKITSFKDNRIVAHIIEGGIDATSSSKLFVQLMPHQNLASQEPPHAPEQAPGRWKVTFTARLLDSSIATQQKSEVGFEKVTMNGSNVGIFSTLDYKSFDPYSLSAVLGYELYKISGTGIGNVCGGQSTRQCILDLNYIVLSGLAKYNIIRDGLDYWLGLGATLRSPLKIETNSISKKDLSYANSILFAVGAEYKLSNKGFIPFSFEYEYSLNTSDAVPEINQIGLQIGYGFRF